MYNVYNGIYDRAYGWGYKPTFSDGSLAYWERSLFQRMTALFKIDGLPTAGAGQVQWDKDAFLYGLFKIGFLPVFRSKRYGWVFQPATPAGIGLFYQPTGMTINTPYFQISRPLVIGTECEVLKLTPDYRGIWDIVSKYANELQLMDIAIRQSSINARFAYAIAAPNKQSAESAKALFERMENGENVVVDTKMMLNREDGEYRVPWQQFDRDLKQNFILLELLEARHAMMQDFYREIGVQIAPDKKERQITSEQAAYNAEVYNRREVWNMTLQESVKRVNDFSGLSISVEYNEEVTEDASTDKQDSGSTQSDGRS